jgi:hypothetical protein
MLNFMTTRLRKLLVGIGTLTVAFANSGAFATEPSPVEISNSKAEHGASAWSVKMPANDRTEFHGVVSFDKAGSASGVMLYPAPGAAGLIAAIVTHGLIVGSVNSSQKKKIQDQADVVLKPYEPSLNLMSHRSLLTEGIRKSRTGGKGRLAEYGETPDGNWFIEIHPVFSMTQDQKAIVLDTLVDVHPPGFGKAPTVQMAIHVVSDPQSTNTPEDFWNENQGARLMDISAGLLAESIDISLKRAQLDNMAEGGPQKTIRYVEGDAERMERAQLLEKQCGRALLKTLRGTLMSVPQLTRADSAEPAASCINPG